MEILKKISQCILLALVCLPFTCVMTYAAPLSTDDFMRLCLEGSSKEVQMAIQEGADVNAISENGLHILIFAMRNSDIGVLKALIKSGADIHYKLDERSVINLAVLMGSQANPEALEVLIKAKANLKELYDGATLLHIAAGNTDTPAALKTLVKAGLNVNARTGDGEGRTPLMNAAINQNNPDVIFTLLDLGGDPKLRSRNGFIALDYLRANKEGLANSSVLDRLVRDGNVPDFFELCKSGSANEIKTALKQGASPNAVRNEGFTALMAAAMFNGRKAIAALVVAGADVNAKDDDGATALMFAAMKTRDPEAIRYLLKAGANANVRADGACALDFARGNESLVNSKALQELERATQ